MGLTTGPTKEAICIDQSLVKQRTLINTSTMDTAVDAAVIRGRRCRGDSWTKKMAKVQLKPLIKTTGKTIG